MAAKLVLKLGGEGAPLLVEGGLMTVRGRVQILNRPRFLYGDQVMDHVSAQTSELRRAYFNVQQAHAGFYAERGHHLTAFLSQLPSLPGDVGAAAGGFLAQDDLRGLLRVLRAAINEEERSGG